MTFGCFSIFWTTITFLLSGPPFFYDEAIIGLFGLVGIAGALSAPLAGILGDKFGPYINLGFGISCIIIAYIILILWQELPSIIIGAFILDMGCQISQVSNQTRIYSLATGVRSRLNCVYMFGYFLGASLGSGLGSLAYNSMKWKGSCITAFSFLGVALITYLIRKPKKGEI
jgi:predicted MFS family arabinose efflux permease